MAFRFFVLGLAALSAASLSDAATVDTLVFGNAASENAHAVSGERSEIVAGLLGEPARRLLPKAPVEWRGGTVAFTLTLDSEKQNYITARFSGNEISDGRLLLYADGKQIGWRHLGEVDQLDFGTWEPAYNGRFYYTTSPLPLALTKGKREMRFEIRSSGPIWGYGQTWDRYQRPMTAPSRGVYRIYAHTDGLFVPSAEEKQGVAPRVAPVRASPGVEVLEQIKARVNREVAARLASKTPNSQMQMQLLAKAYEVKWTVAFENSRAIAQILASLDALFAAYRKDPKLAHEEPSTWNPDWFGLGVCGQVIALREAELKGHFDEAIDDGRGGTITRRGAFTEMLVACRDWHRLNRRQYTNQSMLNDLYGIYLANRGIAVLEPARALAENQARRYLYEAVGLEPWRDSDEGGRKWNVGSDYWQLTAKGLTKELGYVGTYGEVIDLVADIYNATRPRAGEPGDEKIKAQLVKIARARAVFRHPSLDAEGNRAMRLEQVVGWRDSHHPGHIVYGQRATRDASALQAAAITLDPQLVGYAQQMLADNQFFPSEIEAMGDGAQPLRTTIGRLETPEAYALICAQPPSPHRLAMGWSEPDFVFSDEEDGVVAIKRGEEILYVSLYWRARFGINELARVHFLTPACERIAVVSQRTQFEPSGLEFVWPNWTNMAFFNGGLKYPGDIQSAHTGEKQPIAKIPAGVAFKPGQESPYAGRGSFYTLRYGAYVVGLNMSADKSFDLVVPPEAAAARELGANRNVPPGATLTVAPRSTVVLHLQF